MPASRTKPRRKRVDDSPVSTHSSMSSTSRSTSVNSTRGSMGPPTSRPTRKPSASVSASATALTQRSGGQSRNFAQTEKAGGHRTTKVADVAESQTESVSSRAKRDKDTKDTRMSSAAKDHITEIGGLMGVSMSILDKEGEWLRSYADKLIQLDELFDPMPPQIATFLDCTSKKKSKRRERVVECLRSLVEMREKWITESDVAKKGSRLLAGGESTPIEID